MFSMMQAASTLRTWRKGRDLTQDEAAKMLGVDQPTLSHFERGTRVPDIHQALTIERVTLGVVAVPLWDEPQSRRRSA